MKNIFAHSALDFVTIFHMKNAFHDFIYDLAENNSPKPNGTLIFNVKVVLSLSLTHLFFLWLLFSVFSENVVRLKSSMIALSLSADPSPLARAQALFSSELGGVILSVLLLHFAGFFVG